MLKIDFKYVRSKLNLSSIFCRRRVCMSTQINLASYVSFKILCQYSSYVSVLLLHVFNDTEYARNRLKLMWYICGRALHQPLTIKIGF